MTPQETQKMIDDSIRKAMQFQTAKYGDTPTDNLQLTPKKYVDTKTGAPGGSDTQVQFNDAGVFGGDANLVWDKTNRQLTILDNGNGFAVQDTSNNAAFFGVNSVNNFQVSAPGTNSAIQLGADGLVELNSGNSDIILSSNGPGVTTATTGFIRIPIVPGAPTGVPASLSGLALVYDSTNNDLYIYNSGWKKVHLA